MRLILNGGGSGEDIKESYELFASKVKGGRIMYIPLAWNHGPCGECIHWFRIRSTKEHTRLQSARCARFW